LPRSDPNRLPFVRSVFHPTDFSEASRVAFVHALAIALIRQTKLWILHAGERDRAGAEWTGFPGVRDTLERWGLLEPGAPRSAVFDELRVRVAKVAVEARNPVDACLDFLRDHEPDLMVLATEGRQGLPSWIRPSIAERLARRSHTRTLFVPAGASGFVSPQTGQTSLRRILVPVDVRPDSADAIELAARAAEALGDPPVEIALLHVGEERDRPRPKLPKGEGWELREVTLQGAVVETILAAADTGQADLLVLATAGREGVLEALRGSVTERVVRAAPCPVLAVPAR
jgi:nucleotide-binding universal stress UspA family protein